MNKSAVFFVGLFLFIALAIVAFYSLRNDREDTHKITSFNECVAAGYEVSDTVPRKCTTKNDRVFVEKTKKLAFKTGLIKVTNPQIDQKIQSPLNIEGKAKGYWFFEGDFPVKLLDANGNVIAEHYATAQSEWMTENFVPFKSELNFSSPETKTGTLVLERANPSGLPENADELRVPVRFGQMETGGKPIDETMKIKVYFSRGELASEHPYDCSQVVPVEREIAKTKGVARAALEELIEGPTPEEREKGYVTTINPGVEIRKLTVQNGTILADFNEALTRNIGGSCRVKALRAQITETLNQFPNLQNVEISVNGKTEEILEP